MRTFGLIGKKLGHSFSKKYFTEKFKRENIINCQYELFELSDIEHIETLFKKQPNLGGLNVTIPYKQEVIPFLDGLDELSTEIGAVNVIKCYKNGQKKGFNSDCIGFSKSLESFLEDKRPQALVLGTGGASKAVIVALKKLGINSKLVSRTAQGDIISYAQVTPQLIENHQLIINTTPLGMYPNEGSFPELPYEAISKQHHLYDLVYNPEETAFMKKGLLNGAKAKNGLEMLQLQAEAAWEIWTSEQY